MVLSATICRPLKKGSEMYSVYRFNQSGLVKPITTCESLSKSFQAALNRGLCIIYNQKTGNSFTVSFSSVKGGYNGTLLRSNNRFVDCAGLAGDNSR